MDSEHRHELKTNELADWIGHVPEFARKNIRTIIGVGLIIAAILVSGPVRSMRRRADVSKHAETTSLIREVGGHKLTAIQNQWRGVDMQSMLLVSAQSLDVAASESKNAQLAALSLIKRGEALRSDLHYKAGEVEEVVVRSQINLAQKAYSDAIEKVSGKSGGASFVAMAKFGQGLCAEELGETDRAVAIYKEIASDQEFEGTVFPARVKARLDTIEDSKDEFIFVEAAVPAEEPLPVAGDEAGVVEPVPAEVPTDITTSSDSAAPKAETE